MTAFELIFAFDEAISLGHKENVTVAQVKQYCEMDSLEEQLHKMNKETKVLTAIDFMKKKSAEIDKSKIEKTRIGGFVPSSGFGSSDSSISGGGGGYINPGFGISSDVDSFSTEPKGASRPSALATASLKGSGMKLGKSQRSNQFLESLKAEGENIVEDVTPPVGLSRPAAAPPTDPITFIIEEKLNATLKKDGGISSFDVQGTLSLQLLNEDDGQIQVEVETNPSVAFKTHPNINKELFNKENILAPKDASRAFPVNQPGNGLALLKWRNQSSDESLVPLTINCWPSVSGNETYVNIEYEAFSQFDLQNVVISVPLPTLRDGQGPSVRQIDGESRYDSRNYVLEWSIDHIDNTNRSGCLEFVVPRADPAVFFPMSVHFTATNTFGGLKVVNILPQRGGLAPKYSQKTILSTDNYQVV
ncbi:OLC1v1038893C1 [Oldenlandia corymbosa var. corymbosa]|nr:OLC1v1038893C1 [Oldenlandia corymbosa var. corymbosa]